MKDTKKLSKSLKEKWASGTRKPNPKGYGEKISKKLKQAHKEGRMHVITHDAAMKGLANRDPENIKKANQKLAKARVGKPMPSGPSSATPEHHKSKYWAVYNKALGVKLEGKNLNHIIRENEHFFSPEDTCWNKSCCRASRGLGSLFKIDKRTGKAPGSWKGWIAVYSEEEIPATIKQPLKSPIKMNKLSDTKVKLLKPKQKPYKVFDGEGMYLLINPNGSKYWRLKYRIKHKEKILALGVYPRVTLNIARKKRNAAKNKLINGIDPSKKD